MKEPARSTIRCVCGYEYRGNARFRGDPEPAVYSDLPCPKCGETRCRAVYGDPEQWVIRRDDVGSVES